MGMLSLSHLQHRILDSAWTQQLMGRAHCLSAIEWGLFLTGLLLGMLLLLRLHRLLFCRYIEIHEEEIGKSKKHALPRHLGEVPPVLPNGWYRICHSHELKRGQVISATLCNRNLAVFRGHDGISACMGAYCPHLGANLAVCGEVHGNNLRCPFHGWSFNRKGQCVVIPYSDAPVPKIAKTEEWLCKEVDGMIFVWFDAEGRSPFYDLPSRPEFARDRYRLDGLIKHKVRAHIQELPENGPDSAHLNVLHLPFLLSWLGPVFGHYWTADWRPNTEPGCEHVALIRITQAITFFGKIIPGTHIDVAVDQVGPSVVYLHLRASVGEFLVVQTVTPLAPMTLSVDHHVAAPWYVPRVIAKILAWGLVRQFERDHEIWANKTYLRSPLLVKGDGPIMQFRQHFRKFYSKNSPTVESESAKVLSW